MTRPALISDNNINGILFFCILILLFYYIVSICSSPFTIFHGDPLNGFLAFKNYEAGGQFNYIQSVLATDVSQTKIEFLSWWSPGQYMIPYVLKTMLHLSFISSVKGTVILCLLVLPPGVILLFKYFKFSGRVSLICVLIFLIQRMIFINTWGYDGGDILFISFLPWYLLGFLYAYDARNFIFQFLFILFLTVFAVFIKLTFIVVAISFLFFLLISSYSKRNNLKANIGSAFSGKKVALGLGIGFALAFVYLSFLSRGINPNQINGAHFRWKDSVELLFMPLSIFNFTALTTFLLGKSFLLASLIYLVLFLAVFLAGKMVLDLKDKRFKLLLIAFGCVFFIYLLYSFNLAHVSGGDRHLRLISFLCLPVMIQYLLTNKKNLTFFLLAGVIITGSIYSVFSVSKFKRQTKTHPIIGWMGFDYHTQVGESVSRELLDTLIKIDMEVKNAVFLTNNFHWALDMKNSRYGLIDGDFMTNGFTVKPPAGSNIYILLNTDLFKESAISKDKKYILQTVCQSGDNILAQVVTD